MVAIAKQSRIKMGEELVTPATALRYLGTMKLNRKVTQKHVKKLAHAMRDGEWDDTLGDPLRFDTKGQLIDGQHRLWAVVEAEQPVTFVLRTGLPESAIVSFDQGRPRTLGDMLSMQKEAYPDALAASVRILWNYETTGFIRRQFGRTKRPSTPQLLAFLEKHPHLRDGLRHAGQLRKHLGGGVAPWVVLQYLLSSVDADDAQHFLRRLETGEMLSEGSPILTLRKTLIPNKTSLRPFDATHFSAYVFKAWNYYRDGKDLVKLAYRAGGANPEAYPVPH